jgi:hypothetical protein
MTELMKSFLISDFDKTRTSLADYAFMFGGLTHLGLSSISECEILENLGIQSRASAKFARAGTLNMSKISLPREGSVIKRNGDEA